MLDRWSIRGLLVRANGHRDDAHDTEHSGSASATSTVTVYHLLGSDIHTRRSLNVVSVC